MLTGPTGYSSIDSDVGPSRCPHLRLVLEILPDFPRREVPDLDEPVHGPRHEVLSIWRESRALHVRFLSELSEETNRFGGNVCDETSESNKGGSRFFPVTF